MDKTFLFICLLLISCQSQETPMDVTDSSETIPKIDIHAHYRADRPYIASLMDSFNLRPVLVDVARVDTVAWFEARKNLKNVFQKYPEYFYCAAFVANGIDRPDYAHRVVEMLTAEISQGARMVKVWKNFGMISRDSAGNFVQIDDPRLQPIWDFLTTRKIPVMAHIGEPLQAWRPLEDDNPHANYYRNNPQYHAYKHPETPSWETIQEARNNWLEKNPDLVIVGAHQGSMSHDVELIGEHLEKYPNLYVEPAARFKDLVRQDSEIVRNYFIKHQDRILYGTDLGTSGDLSGMSAEAIAHEREGITQKMTMHWNYLSGKGLLDYTSSLNSRVVKTQALDLPDSVLQKIYSRNAEKVLQVN